MVCLYQRIDERDIFSDHHHHNSPSLLTIITHHHYSPSLLIITVTITITIIIIIIIINISPLLRVWGGRHSHQKRLPSRVPPFLFQDDKQHEER
jgi:hypothetical protein